MAAVVANSSMSVRAAVEDSVKAILAEKLQLIAGEIPLSATLGELGFDSLALSDLAEAIEENFDVQVPNRIFPDTLTVEQLVVLLSQNEKTYEVIRADANTAPSAQRG
jgi:acyl carrier protein